MAQPTPLLVGLDVHKIGSPSPMPQSRAAAAAHNFIGRSRLSTSSCRTGDVPEPEI